MLGTPTFTLTKLIVISDAPTRTDDRLRATRSTTLGRRSPPSRRRCDPRADAPGAQLPGAAPARCDARLVAGMCHPDVTFTEGASNAADGDHSRHGSRGVHRDTSAGRRSARRGAATRPRCAADGAGV